MRILCLFGKHNWVLDHECTVLCEHLFGMNRNTKHCSNCGKLKGDS